MPITGDIPWRDLETKGFVHIPAFLTPVQLDACRRDYAAKPRASSNGNYDVPGTPISQVEHLQPAIVELMQLVAANTNVRIDLPISASYFATKRGVAFSWHQDHESYFMFQNHYDYLNMYVPVVKPRKDKSNLQLIPFDLLKQESPRTYDAVVRGGAAHLLVTDSGKVLVQHDDSGRVHAARTDFRRMACTPQLAEGDLLLLRGDIFHATQDTDTDRVSLSVRLVSTQTVVRRSTMADGGLTKARMMVRNFRDYELFFRAFAKAGTDELTLGDLLQLAMEEGRLNAPPTRSPKRYLLREKVAAGVLISSCLAALRERVTNNALVYYYKR